MKDQNEKQAIEEMRELIHAEIKKAVDSGLITWTEFADYLANALYNAGYRKQEWISVEERLPEKSGYYLICQKSPFWCEEIIQTARWHISSQRFRGAQAGCFMDDVTHWMPLPEPPKMKGGAE